MRFFIVILFLMASPIAAMSQQSSAPATEKDCPLSHWSTTGAACEYAPDLSPAIEADLRQGIFRSKDGL